MIPYIKLHKPTQTNISSFINEPIEINLINDIKTICFDLNTYIGDISMQKERILALNYNIKNTLEYFYYNTRSEMVNNFKYFLLITNRSISDFNIEVQILLNGNLTTFYLIDK